ncbi:MAG TPA: ATP-binding protein [Rhizomicrobium sp.]|jgi:two-component system phosphate regulon sensor histidine kinase PhoR|nr:ATP-binding protein [Rhizomicrobium sp.]
MAAIQALPDAILIVQTENPVGSAPIRVVASNGAAQALLRIRGEDDRLVCILRNPDILSAVESTLADGESHILGYDTGGSQSRAVRVWSRPLAADSRPSALVVLRDETDARRLERMRADFLANASHELRTPLASITGFVETLRGHAKDDSEARAHFLEIMAGQARRMSRLIDDLLSLSRIELNEHVPPSGTCDIVLLVQEVTDGLLPVLEARGARLELLAAAPGKALAVGERDQISQVVQNLLDNAVKYAPHGAPVTVTVATDVAFEADSTSVNAAGLRDAGGGRLVLLSPERAHENRYVQVRITDAGTGIAREHLPRLTERFYRVPGQKSGDVPGTGLGLAIVKHVINRHRGGLVVESAPGQGTSFTVFLPAAPPA